MPVVRAVGALSAAFAAVERWALIALMGAIFALGVCAVGARALQLAVAWMDEAAVLAMAWSCFLGAALLVRRRMDFGVTLLHDAVPAWAVRALKATISLLVAAFGVFLAVLCWWWFDPVGMAGAGFSVMAFQGATFNFVYSEQTPTMGLPTWWFFLVIPWFAVSLAVHGTANLLEDLGLAAARAADGGGVGAEG
jgi:TRAP-type C4-dicarboxylate transport system permease small subunit